MKSYHKYLFSSRGFNFRLLTFPTAHESMYYTSTRIYTQVFPCFPWCRIMLFCFFVSALHPPRAPCKPEVCVFPLRTFFFLALLMLTYLFFFLRFPSFFDFDLDIVCFHLVFFLCVQRCFVGFSFCCDSFSIRMIYK